MKSKLILFIIFISCTAYSQQVSKVKIDKGNSNDVTVSQNELDSSQKLDVDLYNSNNNKIEVNQIKSVDEDKKESSTFWDYINKTNSIITLISSVFLFFVWIGVKKLFIKK